MELKDLIFLGACALLAPEVNSNGFDLAERRIGDALESAWRVWEATVAKANDENF